MSLVIDAHQHFFQPDLVDYEVLPYMPELNRNIGPEHLEPLLEQAGVGHTILVQAAESEKETELLLGRAARIDWISGVVGWLPMTDPEATAQSIERHRVHGSLLRGVRYGLYWEPDDDWVIRDRVLESLALLAANGLVFELAAHKPQHLEHVAVLAERVPNLDIVICHMAMPKIEEGEWEPWASAFARAGAHRRCTVKTSGMDMRIQGCEPERFQPYIDHALEHFGPARMIWASNWPVSLRLQGYAELLDCARFNIAACTELDKAQILGGTANRVYGLGL
jgi:L-fuconolactonase